MGVKVLGVSGGLALALALAGCEAPRGGPAVAAGPSTGRHAPNPSWAAANAAQSSGVYRLQAGDAINVFVFDNPDLTQSAVVAPDGQLSYPLAGSFDVRGRTVNEVRAILTSRFSNTIVDPQVTVSLTETEPFVIYINGEVAQPGAFELRDPITLVQAVSLAGGFTAFADRSRVLIYNPRYAGGARRLFDYDRFLSDPAGDDTFLQPGDTIVVR